MNKQKIISIIICIFLVIVMINSNAFARKPTFFQSLYKDISDVGTSVKVKRTVLKPEPPKQRGTEVEPKPKYKINL